MKFAATLINSHGQKYDLWYGQGVNLVPHESKAPKTGYANIQYIFKVKGFPIPDPDLERFIYDINSTTEA